MVEKESTKIFFVLVQNILFVKGSTFINFVNKIFFSNSLNGESILTHSQKLKLVEVRKFQKGNMKSWHCQKYEGKN